MNATPMAPLTKTASQWRIALAQLCQDSALAQPGEESAMLRLGHALLSNLPDPRSSLGDHLPPAARFEALLAAGAHDSAALALVPEMGSYIVSRAGEGGCMASVLLPGMEEEMTSEGESPALALVSALAAALASCGDEAPAIGEPADWQRPQGAMLH